MQRIIFSLLFVGVTAVFGIINSYPAEIPVTAKRFIAAPESYADKSIVMKVIYVNKASIQDRKGFLKCTCKGAVDSTAAAGDVIMFYKVYLDSDTLDKWIDKLKEGLEMTIHAFVDEVKRNLTRLTVYEIEME